MSYTNKTKQLSVAQLKPQSSVRASFSSSLRSFRRSLNCFGGGHGILNQDKIQSIASERSDSSATLRELDTGPLSLVDTQSVSLPDVSSPPIPQSRLHKCLSQVHNLMGEYVTMKFDAEKSNHLSDQTGSRGLKDKIVHWREDFLAFNEYRCCLTMLDLQSGQANPYWRRKLGEAEDKIYAAFAEEHSHLMHPMLQALASGEFEVIFNVRDLALRASTSAHGRNHPLVKLCALLEDAPRIKPVATMALRRAYRPFEYHTGPWSFETIAAELDYCWAIVLEQPLEAERQLRTSMETCELHLGPASVLTAYCHYILAVILMELDGPEAAEAQLLRFLDLYRTCSAPETCYELVINAYGELAAICSEGARHACALYWGNLGVTCAFERYGADHWLFTSLAYRMRRVFQACGHEEAARELVTRNPHVFPEANEFDESEESVFLEGMKLEDEELEEITEKISCENMDE